MITNYNELRDKALEMESLLINSYTQRNEFYSTIAKLNNIVDQLSTIIWQYDNLGDLSWCPISGLIYEQRDDLSVILENFKSIRKTINDKFNYVSSVENAIAESLKNNKIAYLPINNYEREA